MENKSTSLSNSNDARIIAHFSDDDIKVYADFLPAGKGGKALSAEYVYLTLNRMGVHASFNEAVIKDAVDRCNTTARPVKELLVAQGTLPVDEVTPYYEIDSKLLKPPTPEFKDGQKTDYRVWSPYIIVKKGQVLAVHHDTVPGSVGRTIHDKEVLFKTLQKTSFQGGHNTKTSDNDVISEIDGLFVLHGNTMNVEPTLSLRGAVSYDTGNINFPGDVEMPGQVSEGFKIFSGNNLIVKDTLDVTDVIVKNDLIVKGGMIGKGHGIAKVSGCIDARFIQNCRVACKKEVRVKNDVVNSTIYTMDSLSLSENGTIMGCEVFAFNSVRSGRIGKENSSPTKIHVGIDWTITQELEENENTKRVIEAKLEKVLNYLTMPNLTAEQLAKVQEMKLRLESENTKCEKRRAELEKRYIIGDSGAMPPCVECAGVISVGTAIDIRNVEYIISKPISRVRLVFDNNTGGIVPLPLDK